MYQNCSLSRIVMTKGHLDRVEDEDCTNFPDRHACDKFSSLFVAKVMAQQVVT